MEELKISEKDFITLHLKIENISITLRYNKRSTLKSRLDTLKKMEELLRKI